MARKCGDAVNIMPSILPNIFSSKFRVPGLGDFNVQTEISQAVTSMTIMDLPGWSLANTCNRAPVRFDI